MPTPLHMTPLVPITGAGFNMVGRIKFSTIEVYIGDKNKMYIEVNVYNKHLRPRLLILTLKLSSLENKNIRKVINRQRNIYEKTEYGIVMPEDFRMENIQVSGAYDNKSNYMLVIFDRYVVPIKFKDNNKFEVFLKYLGVDSEY